MAANPLTKKLGPLPVWGWGLAGGGLIGILILSKKGKSNPKAVSEGEAEAQKKLELEQLLQGLENAASGGGSAGGVAGGPEVHTPTTPEQTQTALPPQEPAPAIAPVETPVQATPAPPPLPAASKVAPHPATQHSNAARAGAVWHPGKYKGMAAHIYDRAVHGGVGPHRNIIVLNAGKKTHAKKGQHQPATHKPKRPHVTARTPRAPATVHHAAKKVKAKAAPRKKIAHRAPAKHAAPKRKVHR